MTTTKDFYDSFSSHYTQAIMKCVPRYEEMLATLLGYLPKDFAPRNILELGCGTGNLSSLIVHQYPNSKLVAVDISSDIISECKSRLPDASIEFIQDDFSSVRFSDGSFDLVVSSIAIHHLTDADKEGLFRNVHEWLADKGIFTFSDQFRGETDDIYQKHMDVWRNHANENGVSSEEWDTWMKHQEDHDYHSPVRSHLKWLEKGGFEYPDCIWRYSLWSVLHARKA